MLWVAVCVGGGYAFGNVPVVKDNFSFVALGIIAVSVIPVVVEFLQARSRSRARQAAALAADANPVRSPDA
jgi:membrane protein DedA with SNARE-associated domain